jgi:hypothetical protein
VGDDGFSIAAHLAKQNIATDNTVIQRVTLAKGELEYTTLEANARVEIPADFPYICLNIHPV